MRLYRYAIVGYQGEKQRVYITRIFKRNAVFQAMQLNVKKIRSGSDSTLMEV